MDGWVCMITDQLSSMCKWSRQTGVDGSVGRLIDVCKLATNKTPTSSLTSLSTSLLNVTTLTHSGSAPCLWSVILYYTIVKGFVFSHFLQFCILISFFKYAFHLRHPSVCNSLSISGCYLILYKWMDKIIIYHPRCCAKETLTKSNEMKEQTSFQLWTWEPAISYTSAIQFASLPVKEN